ncbi:MAG: hypothetical protein KDA91_18265, partial [Planctomycetaceae bacterium]|nr:hypothetical protein [Planctomycetaceae bacterium]
MNEDFFMSVVIIHAAQIVAVVAAVMMTGRFLRHRPFVVRCLWLVVLLKCLTPPLVSSQLSVFSWISGPWMSRSLDERQDLHSVSAISDETMAGFSNRSGALRGGYEAEVSATNSLMNDAGFVAADSAWLAIENHSEDPDAEAFSRSAGEFQAGPVLKPVRRFPWFAAGLLASMLTGFLVIALRYASCVKAIRGKRVVSLEDRPQAIANSVAEKMKLKRRPCVWVTDLLFGPAVLGVLRPVIVLPRILLDSMTDDQLRPIVTHELVHIRRGDLWVGLCQATAQCLWWFWPPVWMANRRLTRATEQCCDEETIRISSCSPSEYARILLAVIESKHCLKPVPVFPGMKPVEITSQRMERIMSLTQGSQKRMSWKSISGAMLLAIAVLPGAVPGQTSDQNAERVAEGEVLYQVLEQPGLVDKDDEVAAVKVETIEYAVGDLLERLCKQRGFSELDAKDALVAEIWPFAGMPRAESGVAIWKNDVLLLTHNATGHERIRQRVAQLRKHGFRQVRVQATLISGPIESIDRLLADLPGFGPDRQSLPLQVIDEAAFSVLRHTAQNNVKMNIKQLPDTLVTNHTECQFRDGVDRSILVDVKDDQPQTHKAAEGVTLRVTPEIQENAVSVVGDIEVCDLDDENGVQVSQTVNGRQEVLTVPGLRTQHLALRLPARIDENQALLIGGINWKQNESLLVLVQANPVSDDARPKDRLVTVTGAVKNPGRIELLNGRETRLLDAFNSAVGLASAADSRVVLGRQVPAKTGQIVTTHRLISLADVRLNGKWNDVLKACDSITVSPKDESLVSGRSQALLKKLSQKVTLKFDDTSFMEAVRTIAMDHQVSIAVDTGSLKSANVPLADKRVSLAVTDDTLENALTLLCDECGMSYQVAHEVIRFHAPAADKAVLPDVSGQMTVRCYQVADLVVPMSDANSPEPDEQQMKPDYSGLVELIKTTIAPDSWKFDAMVVPELNTLTLVIRQTDDIHNQIAELLCELRRIAEIQTTTEIRVLRFSSREQIEWLEKNITFHKERSQHPWALLPLKEIAEAQDPFTIGRSLAAPKSTTFDGIEGKVNL